jgi:RHS repeat-associated protein
MDAGGNVSRGSNTFVPASDEITGGSYDAAGDLLQWTTNLGTGAVEYDFLTRLTSVGYKSDFGNQTTITNVFDPLGHRISGDDAYVYDGDSLVDRDSAGVSEYYIWGPTGLIQEFGATQENGSLSPVAVYTYSFDPNGNTVDRVDDYPNGSGYKVVLDLSQAYDAYGELVWQPDPFIPGDGYADLYVEDIPQALVHRYKGQYGYVTDTESNLIYCLTRFYDPYSARWITRDPSGLDGGINTYQYCIGDPVNSADPSGTDAWPVVVGQFFEQYGPFARFYPLADAAAASALLWAVIRHTASEDVEYSGWISSRNGNKFFPLIPTRGCHTHSLYYSAVLPAREIDAHLPHAHQGW